METNSKNDRLIPPLALSNPLRRLIENPYSVVKRFVREGMVVADIGCGPGFYTIPIAEIVREKGKVYAVDANPKSIEVLKAKAARKGLTNIIAKVSSASDLSFIPDSSVDFVLSKDVLCCMRDHEGAIKEIYRILKTKGLAYITVRRSFFNDPFKVTEKEWKELMSRFNVVHEKLGLFGYEAIVTK